MAATALLTRPAATTHVDVLSVARPALRAVPTPTVASSPALEGDDALWSRWSGRPATVEELVARDIEAFSQRRRRAAR
ncbi:hypothetical protein ATL41_0693 [Flavimobilis soli]|uniref:Uncharacterized protein n=1 Tax=Flavimobilis soli TaxID=442709 RepID=A0A2A9ECJ3_9MICO|nr:hypothetical protein [Flavimobilis soli]PFG35992.1 hypothetical protein ATL41_0693 [Flavimobilis soli]